MLYEELQKWKWDHPGEKVYLIMDTSILNFNQEDIQNVTEEIPYYLCIPKNVYYEMKLLQRSEIYGNKACAIMKIWKQKGAYVFDNMLEDFYDTQEKLQGFVKTKSKMIIFILGSQLKLKEFLLHVKTSNNYYVYYHNQWVFREEKGFHGIMSVEKAKKNVCLLDCVTRCKNMNLSEEIKDVKNIKEVYAKQNGKMKKYILEKKWKYGGESIMYKPKENLDYLLKVFRFSISQNRKRKLESLIQIKSRVEAAILPEAFLITNKGEEIGVLLSKIKGDTLYNVIEEVDIFSCVESLSLALLELNLGHIIVADLALPNIMVGDNGKIYLVDADSFQFAYYMSGVQMRCEYRHKDLNLQSAKDTKLYVPLYQNFSFAVILFQLLVSGTYSPLYQRGAEDLESSELCWGGKFDFPYHPEEQINQSVNQVCNEKWKLLPTILQKGFYDTFQFKQNSSIGYWLYLFDMAMK